MTDSFAPGGSKLAGRLLLLGAATAVTVAAIGFFTGTRQTAAEVARRQTRRGPAPRPAASGSVPGYSDIGSARRGPNAHLYEGALDALRSGLPGPFEPFSKSPEDHARAVAARSERRAFDGAPPRVPHAVRQSDAPDCLACHEKGARIAGKNAPAMSHPHFGSCPQCHVPAADPRGFGPSSPPPENEFVGLEAPGPGGRAWPGAPPTIPHSTRMREVCTSCHGVGGALGLRTPHPYRESCTQCHVPQAGGGPGPVAEYKEQP